MEHHKYINDLGISSYQTCLFNTNEVDKDRNDLFQDQRNKYGFDERETWSLDFTLVAWLYSHLKMYEDIGGEIVNLDYHTVEIPELIPIPHYELEFIGTSNIPVAHYTTQITTHTFKESIELACKYFENFIRNGNQVKDAAEGMRDLEEAQCGIKIVAEILDLLWW